MDGGKRATRNWKYNILASSISKLGLRLTDFLPRKIKLGIIQVIPWLEIIPHWIIIIKLKKFRLWFQIGSYYSLKYIKGMNAVVESIFFADAHEGQPIRNKGLNGL